MSIFTKIGRIFKKKFIPYADRVYLDSNKKPLNTPKPPLPPPTLTSKPFYKNGKRFYLYSDGTERADDGRW